MYLLLSARVRLVHLGVFCAAVVAVLMLAAPRSHADDFGDSSFGSSDFGSSDFGSSDFSDFSVDSSGIDLVADPVSFDSSSIPLDATDFGTTPVDPSLIDIAAPEVPPTEPSIDSGGAPVPGEQLWGDPANTGGTTVPGEQLWGDPANTGNAPMPREQLLGNPTDTGSAPAPREELWGNPADTGSSAVDPAAPPATDIAISTEPLAPAAPVPPVMADETIVSTTPLDVELDPAATGDGVFSTDLTAEPAGNLVAETPPIAPAPVPTFDVASLVGVSPVAVGSVTTTEPAPVSTDDGGFSTTPLDVELDPTATGDGVFASSPTVEPTDFVVADIAPIDLAPITEPAPTIDPATTVAAPVVPPEPAPPADVTFSTTPIEADLDPNTAGDGMFSTAPTVEPTDYLVADTAPIDQVTAPEPTPTTDGAGVVAAPVEPLVSDDVTFTATPIDVELDPSTTGDGMFSTTPTVEPTDYLVDETVPSLPVAVSAPVPTVDIAAFLAATPMAPAPITSTEPLVTGVTFATTPLDVDLTPTVTGDGAFASTPGNSPTDYFVADTAPIFGAAPTGGVTSPTATPSAAPPRAPATPTGSTGRPTVTVNANATGKGDVTKLEGSVAVTVPLSPTSALKGELNAKRECSSTACRALVGVNVGYNDPLTSVSLTVKREEATALPSGRTVSSYGVEVSGQRLVPIGPNGAVILQGGVAGADRGTGLDIESVRAGIGYSHYFRDPGFAVSVVGSHQLDFTGAVGPMSSLRISAGNQQFAGSIQGTVYHLNGNYELKAMITFGPDSATTVKELPLYFPPGRSPTSQEVEATAAALLVREGDRAGVFAPFASASGDPSYTVGNTPPLRDMLRH